MPTGYKKDGTKFVPPSRKGVKLTEAQKEKMRGRVGKLNGFYGKKHSEKTKKHLSEIKKGVPSGRLGIKATVEAKKNMSLAQSGEKSWKWQGNDASLKAKKQRSHTWIETIKGKPKKCDFCGIEKAFFDWSNKNHKYEYLESDWQRLCRKCHIRYDIDHNNLLQRYAPVETQ